MTSIQLYQVFIKATPEQIWAAIVDPDLTRQYFHGAAIVNTPETHLSHGPDGDTWGEGRTLEWDPPRRLVHEWSSLYDPELAAEETSRVSWDIDPEGDGVCRLTLTHDRLEGAPKTAQSVAGPGWMFVLSGLKTVVETGGPMAA